MISVLLPVRNGANTLENALESLMTQRLQPSECVVIDDGSTDATPALLAEWQARWPALRALRTPGLGIARALNLGLELCRFPWIARMDADDRCHPDRLDAQMKAAAADRRRVLVGTQVSCANAGEGMARHVEWANTKLAHEELELALWVDSPLPHPSWLAHQRAWKAAGTYDESGDLPEDYEWLHRFFAAARADSNLRAHKVDTALVEWMDSPARLTRTHEAYSTTAFDRVKARALRALIGENARDTIVFGLGPKGKALVPLLKDAVGVTAIVDVNPRHEGLVYHDTPVWSVDAWKSARLERPPFVVNCVGTPEARANCERLCVDSGLKPLKDFVSL